MRNIKIFKLLLMVIASFAIASCDDDPESDSVMTSFARFPVTTSTAAVVAPEADEETYTFNFTMDAEKQVNPIVLEVEVADNSTATEDVDFELSAHEFEFDAFEGQDGFTIDITVLQDFEIEEGDETIYLTFKTADPSGVESSQVLAVTIKDSGLGPQPGETADFALSWDFTDPILEAEDVCEYPLDLDVTLQPAGSDPYDQDLLGNAAAGSACVEEGPLTLADMVDGEVYDVWVYIYGDLDLGELSPLTVTLAYQRENTDFSGTLVIEDVFDSRQDDVAVAIGTIERNGDVLTLKDALGEVVSEGRVSTRMNMIKNVKKPF